MEKEMMCELCGQMTRNYIKKEDTKDGDILKTMWDCGIELLCSECCYATKATAKRKVEATVSQIKKWASTLERDAIEEAHRLLNSGAIDTSKHINMGALYRVVMKNLSETYQFYSDDYDNLRKF